MYSGNFFSYFQNGQTAALKIGSLYLFEGLATTFGVLKSKYPDYFIVVAIIYIVIGLTTVYAVTNNRPCFLFPLMVYSALFIAALFALLLAAIVMVIDPQIISKDIPSSEVSKFRLVGLIACPVIVLVMLIKVWFFKAVNYCYKYINRIKRDRTEA
uniref:MARVEL domain-containing protein n=1 Tax=Steinernema glaseri TaxID=37863 RepID=A0A1I8AVV7_9BILA